MITAINNAEAEISLLPIFRLYVADTENHRVKGLSIKDYKTVLEVGPTFHVSIAIAISRFSDFSSAQNFVQCNAVLNCCPLLSSQEEQGKCCRRCGTATGRCLGFASVSHERLVGIEMGSEVHGIPAVQ